MKIITGTLLLLTLLACRDNAVQKESTKEIPTKIDRKEDATLPTDATGNQKNSSKEIQVNRQKIVEKFGSQLDFCSCIQFHDSLNNAAQKDLSDRQIEQLLKRWGQMEVKCKELVNTEHRTPEERLAHVQKVSNCLNAK